MVFRIILTILLLVIPGCAGSFSNYSTEDYHYQAAATILTVADWNQTLQFEENGRNEQNFILGDHPSRGRINTLIPLAIAGQWLTAWILPPESMVFGLNYSPRRIFQMGVIAGEGWAVNHNYQVGIKVKF